MNPNQPQGESSGRMVICHSKRFAVLLTWKAASQTIQARLERYQESSYEAYYHFNPYLARVVHQHMTCADFVALPESKFGYFTAAFVRNPYDRVYSGFRQVRSDVIMQPEYEKPVGWVRHLVMKQIAKNFSKLCAAGFDFDSWVAQLSYEDIYDIGTNMTFPLHPSHYWTHYGDRQFVDFIGRVECFEEDFERLCSKLGVEAGPAIDLNVSEMPNHPNHNEYKYVTRMNRHSIDRINELFRNDFELLGYERL
jgi:hypothetical protein